MRRDREPACSPPRRPGRGLALLLTLLSLAPGGPASLAADPLRGALEARVGEAKRAAQALGIHIVDVASGETVFELRPDEPRIIASNTKLFTTAAALAGLGPGFFFETDLLMQGAVDAGILEGDLAVVGGGDPNISGRHYEGDPLAVFRDWAARLRQAGVEKVHGDVFLVHGRFLPPRVHPDWPEDQLGRWYEAPVEALSFNDNCMLVRVRPGRRAGDPARVELVPELPVLEIRNRTRTISSPRQHLVSIERLDGSRVVTVSGSVYRHAAPVETWVTVPEPLAYFGAALRRAFDEGGVELAGEMRPTASLPFGHWDWAAGYRTDLMTAAEVTNKRSQNFFAESLLKSMGYELCGEGSWDAGRRVVEEFLQSIEMPAGEFHLADGSGMSRKNRFTPRQITHLLRHMYSHPRGREFLLTLPYSGEPDLKWESRLSEPPYRGNVFAKTGSLTGVSTLSGYAKARSGRIYAFSILCNRIRGNWQAQKAQDSLIRALVDNG